MHFIVIPKQRITPTTINVEQNSFIPQWAIAVIVIGAGSLMFVIIFGAAVVSEYNFKSKITIELWNNFISHVNLTATESAEAFKKEGTGSTNGRHVERTEQKPYGWFR